MSRRCRSSVTARRPAMASVVLGLCLVAALASTASAERSVAQWWSETYGTAYPGPPAPGSDVQYWTNHIQGAWQLSLEEAGFRDQNEFGWQEWDPSTNRAVGDLHPIFSGADSPGAIKSLRLDVTHFVFYLRTPQARTYLTSDPSNPDGLDHAWVWEARQQDWVIAWEDWYGTSGNDLDHNDMVVRMNVTPELPSGVLLLSSGVPLLGLARFLVRRRR